MKEKIILSVLLVGMLAGCASQGLLERERRVNSLERQAEEARENNNYSRAEDLERQAKTAKDRDDFDDANMALGVVLLVSSWVSSLFSEDEPEVESSGWP
ncbi:hypothetical protein [Microbulbifer aggregans]|uniref:hypothetical protein n=1 Tax=Microbulbifer aggregans TaxID=1769779 RepID=UPI001CFD0D97|nr:hypothetical protein [Microbulbifer aggregans]